jgi:hypothetical protein
MARLELMCAFLRMHGVHHEIHRADVQALTPDALKALAPLLRSYGFDPDCQVHVYQLLRGVLLEQ